MTDEKPPRRPSTASSVAVAIIAVLVVASLFVPFGIALTRLALGF